MREPPKTTCYMWPNHPWPEQCQKALDEARADGIAEERSRWEARLEKLRARIERLGEALDELGPCDQHRDVTLGGRYSGLRVAAAILEGRDE